MDHGLVVDCRGGATPSDVPRVSLEFCDFSCMLFYLGRGALLGRAQVCTVIGNASGRGSRRLHYERNTACELIAG